MAKHTQGAKPKAEKAGVVLLEKVRESVLDASLELIGEPTDGSLKEKVLRLSTYFSENLGQEADLVQCDCCNAVADVTKLDDNPLPHRCPYCADGEAEGVSAPRATQQPKPTAKAPVPPKPEEPKVYEGEVIDMKAKREEKAATGGGKLTRVRASAADKKTVTTTGETTVADLDAKLDECREATIQGARSYVALSKALLEIDEQKLWKHRLNSEGKKAYENFEQFALAELQMSRGHAYKAITVAKAFTPELIEKIGQSKLSVIAGFKDPEIRAALLEEAAKGTGKRGLERKGRQLAGGEESDGAEDKVTVGLMLKRVRLTMLTRKGNKPAKKIADDPHCEYELTNGVVLKFRLQASKAGAIELVMTPQRQGD